jgi:hypothetical protein
MNKIEQYLIELKVSYSEIAGNMWLIEDEDNGLNGVVAMYTEPLVVLRAAVMEAPQDNRLELFTKLLELNANDVVHGAYALDGSQIVLVDTLLYETLDIEEFRASLDAFSLALMQHYPLLSKYRSQEA